MTPALVLLHRACVHHAEATYLVPRLDLARKPFDRADRLELEMWAAFTPLLQKHGGDRAAIRQGTPERWAFYLDLALVQPEWLVERAEPTPDLLKRWNARGSKGWELPREPLGVKYDERLIQRVAA